MWDVPLDQLRSSRLLALRMHVARYVVRAGAQQRSAVAYLDAPTAHERGPLLTELLEAAGARDPQVLPQPPAGTALAYADVLLFGHSGSGASAVAERVRADDSRAAAIGSGGAQVWAVDVDALAPTAPGPGIVESVEALIRIVMPEALGANGTPPPEAVAVRVR